MAQVKLLPHLIEVARATILFLGLLEEVFQFSIFVFEASFVWQPEMKSGREQVKKTGQFLSNGLSTQLCCVSWLEEAKLTSQSLYVQPPILRKKHLRVKTICECHSFHILFSADKERNHMHGAHSQPAPQHLFVCINSHICNFNLLTSKCANAQLAGTKPASVEDRPLPSPPLCIKRADVSCTVIFWVAAGRGERWFWPLLREGTRTCQQPKGLWSFGFMEKVSAFSASAVVPQQPFCIQHLKSYNPTLNYRQSSGELLWLLGAAERGTHAKHKNSTVSVLDLQACI